ncbi:MAG: AAA family ATPase [Beijerinckiaceae bacterium]
MSSIQPALWLIAGPNGVGKTTYAFRQIRRVSGSVNFVNLDEIARGLSPLQPDAQQLRAARIALSMQAEFMRQGQSFSLETTLSGLTYLGLVDRAKAAGFRVHMQFFSVPTVDVSIARVAKRVARGGHNVPERDIRRRYIRAHDNFFLYAARVDDWLVWENGATRAYTVAGGRMGCIDPLSFRRGGRYLHLPQAFRAGLEAMVRCAPEGVSAP